MRVAALAALLWSFAFAAGAESQSQSDIPAHPKVRIDTTLGTLVAELDYERAPLTVESFLQYVEEGFYDGTIFHRVQFGFVAQGGGYTADLIKKETRDPVFNESGNGLSNTRGTIAMARTGKPHSSTSQFFINLVNNEGLDPTPLAWGYAVFGKIVQGMDVVDKIAHTPTAPEGDFENLPQPLIVIERIVLVEDER